MSIVSYVRRLSSVMKNYFNNPGRECTTLTASGRTLRSCDKIQTKSFDKGVIKFGK